MKRFFGMIMAGAGGVGTLWGGFHVITGKSQLILDPLPVNAMYGGLIGLSCLVLGLVWARD